MVYQKPKLSVRILLNLPLRILVLIYRQFFSALIGKNCRFQPTCSAYALECLEHFWPPKACYLIAKRLLKCHPFHQGGFDYPPIERKDADLS